LKRVSLRVERREREERPGGEKTFERPRPN